MFKILAHPVVLHGEEDRIEYDAEGDGRLEQHVVDDGVEEVLKAEPELVVKAAAAATNAVAVGVGLCGRERKRKKGLFA